MIHSSVHVVEDNFGCAATRPNVLFVLTDQQRADSTGLGGNPLGLTPHFDRLALRGTYLANCLTPQPVCTPARACLQTGQYFTRHGVFRNGIYPAAHTRMLGNHFADAGYHTAYIGKWHLAPGSHGPVSPEYRGGYQHWLAANAPEMVSHPYDCRVYNAAGDEVRLPGYRVDAVVDATIRHLTTVGDKPFFCFLSLLEPHQQNDADAYISPIGTRQGYEGRWTPPDLQGLVGAATSTSAGQPGGTAARDLASYWAMVHRIDNALGRLQDALISLRLSGHTIVVFTSDHGCHFGTRCDHDKCAPHDAALRVPGGIWGRGFDGGGYLRAPVSLIDLPPTLMQACGLNVPPEFQGHSFWPALHDPVARTQAEQKDVYAQVSQTQLTRVLRTNRWKYAATTIDGNGWTHATSDRYRDSCLYDLENDPHELCNLVGFESHNRVATHLREQLLKRMTDAGEPPAVIEPALSRPSGQRKIYDSDLP